MDTKTLFARARQHDYAAIEELLNRGLISFTEADELMGADFTLIDEPPLLLISDPDSDTQELYLWASVGGGTLLATWQAEYPPCDLRPS